MIATGASPACVPTSGMAFSKTAELHCLAGAMNIYINNSCMLSARSGGTNSTPLLPHFRISRPRLITFHSSLSQRRGLSFDEV
jgi:hypothetical protein